MHSDTFVVCTTVAGVSHSPLPQAKAPVAIGATNQRPIGVAITAEPRYRRPLNSRHPTIHMDFAPAFLAKTNTTNLAGKVKRQ